MKRIYISINMIKTKTIFVILSQHLLFHNIITNCNIDACPYNNKKMCVRAHYGANWCIGQKEKFKNETRRCIKIKQKLIFHCYFAFFFLLLLLPTKDERRRKSQLRVQFASTVKLTISFTLLPFECIRKR